MNSRLKHYLLLGCSLLILAAFSLFGNFAANAADETDIIGFIRQHGLISATFQGNQSFSFAFVAIAGLLDGVNPCSIHLILLLVGYLLLFVKDRKRSTQIGFAFIVTIFVTYFIFGAVLSSVIGQLLQASWYIVANKILTWGIAFILGISALINIKDAIVAHQTTIDLKNWETSFISKKLAHLHFPGTILLAFISTIFMLPCSLPLYLGSIHILARTFGMAEMIGFVFIYSFMFVVPLFIVLSVLLRAEQYVNVEDFSPKSYRKLRFVESIVQLAIAAILLFS
jgi:cytochrome c biogenesis protein CcdA